MSADADLIKLYSTRILALAADIPHLGKLDTPDIEIKKRAPLCGSSISIGVRFDGPRIADFAQDVKACALGQAAAAVVGASVIGLTKGDIVNARDQLLAMLKEEGPIPSAPFEGLEVLKPAAAYKNRHASIMLSLDALCEAFNTHEKTPA